MPSRRTRRRLERQRAKRATRVRRLSPLARLGLIVGGLLMIAAGIAILVAGSSGNAQRLGRLAGILILIGLIIAAAGAIGQM